MQFLTRSDANAYYSSSLGFFKDVVFVSFTFVIASGEVHQNPFLVCFCFVDLHRTVWHNLVFPSSPDIACYCGKHLYSSLQHRYVDIFSWQRKTKNLVCVREFIASFSTKLRQGKFYSFLRNIDTILYGSRKNKNLNTYLLKMSLLQRFRCSGNYDRQNSLCFKYHPNDNQQTWGRSFKAFSFWNE